MGKSVRPGSGIGGLAPEVDLGKDAPDVIEVKFVGSGITFVAKPGATGHDLSYRVQRLNERVKPLFNEVIRASAHLNGTKDYKSVYENNFAELFGPKKEKKEEE